MCLDWHASQCICHKGRRHWVQLPCYRQISKSTLGRHGSTCLMILLCQNGMQVNVINNIPADFPSAADGISIHWHGFSMRGNEWYDGTGHIAQCPILPGANFTYYFQVSHTDILFMSSCVKCFSRCRIWQGNCQCARLGFCNSACCSKSCSMHSWSVLIVLSTSLAPAE